MPADQNLSPVLSTSLVAPWLESSCCKDARSQTEDLKKMLAHAMERQPRHLVSGEFDRILDWKLEGQRHRVKHLLVQNPGELIADVTRFALNVRHTDFAYETAMRLEALMILRGVDIGVASAVLALCFPSQHAVIDFRGWRQAFGEDRRQFSVRNYLAYLDAIRPLADGLKVTVQEVDLALWCRDRYLAQSEGASQ